MQELYVNDMINDRGYTIGAAVLNKTVLENLHLIFTPDKMAVIGQTFKDNPGGSYFYDRFCQYIIHVQYSEQQGLTMSISDYNQSLRIALDEYMEWAESEWKENDIAQITKLFRDMEADTRNLTLATMVLKDPL